MATSLICSDLTVVELGDGRIAASLAGMILADNGARVVTVEPPAGDRLRTSLPSGWLVWNRGKESLVADLSDTGGATVVAEWLRAADVVIDGLDVGESDALGIGEAAHARPTPVLYGPRSPRSASTENCRGSRPTTRS